jgi:hypothetical protein
MSNESAVPCVRVIHVSAPTSFCWNQGGGVVGISVGDVLIAKRNPCPFGFTRTVNSTRRRWCQPQGHGTIRCRRALTRASLRWIQGHHRSRPVSWLGRQGRHLDGPALLLARLSLLTASCDRRRPRGQGPQAHIRPAVTIRIPWQGWRARSG